MIDVQNPGENAILTNTLSSSNGELVTKTGSGTLTLTGYSDNYSLNLNVQQGTVVMAKATPDAVRSANVATVSAGATLQMGGGGSTQLYTGVYNMNGTLDLNGMNEGLIWLNGTGTVTNNAVSTTSVLTVGSNAGGNYGQNYNNLPFAGVLADGAGVLSLTVSSVASLTLTGTGNAYSGGTNIAAGTLQIGDGSTGPGSLPGNVVVNSTAPGALTFNTPGNMSLAVSGNISGPGGLTKSGGGLAILSGSNSYGGETNVNGGVLEATTTAALPNALTTGSISVAPGAVLAVQAQTADAPGGWTNANINALAGNANVVFSAGSALGVERCRRRRVHPPRRLQYSRERRADEAGRRHARAERRKRLQRHGRGDDRQRRRQRRRSKRFRRRQPIGDQRLRDRAHRRGVQHHLPPPGPGSPPTPTSWSTATPRSPTTSA